MTQDSKGILMVALEVPPCLSAGVQRTFHFAENLSRLGWRPHILSAHERIYQKRDEEVRFSPNVLTGLRRAFALDVSNHLAIKGKYWGALETPDRFGSWYFAGWRKGCKMVREEDIDVIWSTFPVSTAHAIALKVKLKTGLPWVADFRDPLHSHVTQSAKINFCAKKIDRKTVEIADVLVFATENMSDLYKSSYPYVDDSKFVVIENGYDDKIFENLTRSVKSKEIFTLLYSGALYSEGRDASTLFKAIASLKSQGIISSINFRLRFRGSGLGENYLGLLRELDILDVVEFLPSVSYKQSVQEMKDSNALLVIQGAVFNNQIPGKVYEYIASENSILGIVGKFGATERLLKSVSQAAIASEGDLDEIVRALKLLINNGVSVTKENSKYSRKAKSEDLVSILEKFR